MTIVLNMNFRENENLKTKWNLKSNYTGAFIKMNFKLKLFFFDTSSKWF
jgi:hypothetical protein